MHEAIIIVDLGYGDSGKGTLTDALVRRHAAGLVVRFNGGAQAAHAVVTDDGRTHVFHQFGSGTFVPGVETYLSRHVLFNPLALFWEERELRRVGVTDAYERLWVDPAALLTTPYHVVANRLREWARGDGRHGSCGLGIGETMADALTWGDRVPRVSDLSDVDRLRERFRWHRAAKREQMAGVIARARANDVPGFVADALAELNDEEEMEAALEVCAGVGRRINIAPTEFLRERLSRPGTTVFEGAQGVLLDEWRGFHPYTTWSTTTGENAHALLNEAGFAGRATTLGAIRAYSTRHGAGPFVTEDADLTRRLPDTHNGTNPWQREFRVGWLDLVALRYALSVAGPVDTLAVTNIDRMAGLSEWCLCDAYEARDGDTARFFRTNGEGKVTDLRVGPPRDLEYQEALAARLQNCAPVYCNLSPGEEGALLAHVAGALGRPVVITSHGPVARDKRFLG